MTISLALRIILQTVCQTVKFIAGVITKKQIELVDKPIISIKLLYLMSN